MAAAHLLSLSIQQTGVLCKCTGYPETDGGGTTQELVSLRHDHHMLLPRGIRLGGPPTLPLHPAFA